MTLQALDPMFVDFYLPQQALGADARRAGGEVRLDAYPGRSFAGTVAAVNAKVDTASRMVQVRASLANPDRALLPGMFATVTVDVGAGASSCDDPVERRHLQSLRQRWSMSCARTARSATAIRS